MGEFIRFMNGPLGRGARIVAGLALIYLGLVTIGGPTGTVVAAVGVLPIGFGASGHCLVEFLPGGRG